jgi:hypothetical protein
MARLTLGRANMNRQILKDGLGWGVVLWLIGYSGPIKTMRRASSRMAYI